MNVKNHTGFRFVTLQGQQNEVATWSAGTTLPWYLRNLPANTGRLANYLVGFIVTVVASINKVDESPDYAYVDDDDVARALFESCELKNTLFGKPISHNYYKGELFGIFGHVGNGMRRACPRLPVLRNSYGATVYHSRRYNFFIPAAALLGMKGHHATQLAIFYDGATFELKCGNLSLNASGADNIVLNGTTTVSCTAVLQAEPEIRLGPGTQFVRMEKVTSSGATMHMVESLGNTGSLTGIESGAGIAFLAWLTSQRGLGGSFAHPYNLEYINTPFRGQDQLLNLDGLFYDFLAQGSDNDILPSQNNNTALQTQIGPWAGNSCLYAPLYSGEMYGPMEAQFVPIISPKRYMELTKLQSVEGTVQVNSKIGTESFSGNDVFVALQYHSWTPAQQEECFKRIISSGLANTVWGTVDLVPKTKTMTKQKADDINRAKTRYLPMVWEPAAKVENPPSPASVKV